MASRPARSFTAALGIAVGIATVLSVQVIDHNTILTQERMAQVSPLGTPDVELRPVQPGVPEGGALPTALAGDPDLQGVCALFFNFGEVAPGAPSAESDEMAWRETQICGVGPLAAASFGAYHVAEGRDLSGPGELEVLVPERLVPELGVKLGDKVSLRRVAPVRRGCKEGELVVERGKAPPGAPVAYEVVGILAPVNLGAQPLLVVPFEAGAELYRDAHLQPLYWGKLKQGAVRQDLSQRLKSSWVVQTPKYALVGERIDQRAFRKSLRVTSCLALLVGLFVIYNAFSLALVERVREIGLLRALGLKRGEIARTVLLEGFLLALFGAVLGLVLAALLVAFMAALHITTLGAGKAIVILEIPWGITAAVVGAGMLFALFGMAAPLLRARHLSVIEALRAGRLALRSDPGFSLRIGVLLGAPLLIPFLYEVATPPLGERQDQVLSLVIQLAAVVAAFFVVLLAFPTPIQKLVEWTLKPWRLLWPVEERLAESAVRGARQRVLGTLTGLSVVVAAIFVVRAVNQGFLDEIARFSDWSMDGRIYVRTRPMAKAKAEALLHVQGVARVYTLSAEVMTPFALRGMQAADVRASRERLGMSEEAFAQFAQGETILLSHFLADSFGWRPGDMVSLSTFTGPKSFRVGAISDGVGYYRDDRSFAVIEMQRMDELFCVDDQEGRHWVLELEPGADPDAIIADVSERLPRSPDRRIESHAEIKSWYLRDGRKDFYVFDVILWMTAGLAGVGLLNSLAVAMLERRREIGLLRTVGLTAKQVGRMLLLESLAVGCVGGILATALSIPVSRLALDAVRVISRLELRYVLRWSNVAGPFLACVAIAFVAALWPARRSGKLELGPLHRHE